MNTITRFGNRDYLMAIHYATAIKKAGVEVGDTVIYEEEKFKLVRIGRKSRFTIEPIDGGRKKIINPKSCEVVGKPIDWRYKEKPAKKLK